MTGVERMSHNDTDGKPYEAPMAEDLDTEEGTASTASGIRTK
jgi:hypothetical protein